MPYNSTKDLPARVRSMSAKRRRQWMHVWNSSYNKHKDEGRAFAAANAAVKRKKELDVAKTVDVVEGSKSVKVTMFTGADDPELPKHVKALPTGLRSRWANNYNWAVQETMDDDAAEERADEYTAMSISDLLESGLLTTKGEAHVLDVSPGPSAALDTTEQAAHGFMAKLKAWLLADDDGAPTRADSLPAQQAAVQAASGSPAPPALTPTTMFTVYKGEDDRLRTLLVYSNQFKDRQKEIISGMAHEEYVAAAEAGEAPYPDLHLWHAGPGTKWGTVETVSYIDGFAVAGGVVDPGKEHVALKLKELADKGEIAVSFGFYGLRGPDSVYYLYRPFEISPLPAGSEANSLTGYDLALKENGMAVSDRHKEWFKTHFKYTDDDIANVEKAFSGAAQAAKALGIDYKGLGSDAQPTPEPPSPAPTPPAPQPTPPSPAPQPPPAPVAQAAPATDDVGAVTFKQMMEMANVLGGIAQAVKGLQEEFKAYKEADGKTVEQRAQDQVLAKIASAGAGFSPATSTKTLDPSAKASEQDDWLDKAIGGVFSMPELAAPVGGAAVGHINGGEGK